MQISVESQGRQSFLADGALARGKGGSEDSKTHVFSNQLIQRWFHSLKYPVVDLKLTVTLELLQTLMGFNKGSMCMFRYGVLIHLKFSPHIASSSRGAVVAVIKRF